MRLHVGRDARIAFLDYMVGTLGEVREVFAPEICQASRSRSSHIRNEANLTGGENIGGATAAPAAPEAGGDDDDGGGDPDPEPERQTRTRKTRNTSPAGTLPATNAARVSDALAAFPHLPDNAFVDIKVVCAVTARSPASTWRDVKAGRLPAPHKIGPRSTRWQVGELRAALAQLAA